MDVVKVGKFIASLRKEKKITQQELSEKLITSRENVSKWERGINMPTPETLLMLSEIFEVSVNEILSGERKNEENTEKIDNISLEILSDSNKKIKRIITIFISVISLILLVFLLYYFFNTYNTIYVYRIAGENENFSIHEGIAIFSKNKSYMRLGTIKCKSDYKYDRFEIFYYDKKGEEELIFSSDDDNYTLTSIYGNDQYFSYDKMNEVVENIYIKILYQNNEDIIKLEFQQDMKNDNLFFKRIAEIPNEEKEENDNGNNEIIKQIENYFEKTFKYNEFEDYYSYNGYIENFKYDVRYSKKSKLLVINEYKNSTVYVIEFNFLFNDLTYQKINLNNELEHIFTYYIDNKECFNGLCDDLEIQHFMKNYYNKYIQP